MDHDFEKLGVLYLGGELDLERIRRLRERRLRRLHAGVLGRHPRLGPALASLLYTPAGKPRVAIVSIAHLDDLQQMLFVTMLLSAVLVWTHSQPGTTTLRALLIHGRDLRDGAMAGSNPIPRAELDRMISGLSQRPI